jgi:ribose transport system ATP-binding protein
VGDNVLEIRNLTKDFPGLRALDDVSFCVKRNTVHCLVGENGAGKSTLIKILTGALEKSNGTILLNGQPYTARSLREAREKGISTLFQELNSVDQLTVEENLTLGKEDTTLSFLRRSGKLERLKEVLRTVEPGIDPKQLVEDLSVAQKQLVEIAKAVATEADIIIMDEATAAISEGEIDRLFKIIRELKEKKVTFIYISHRLDEVFEVGDYVTVLRDGKHIETKAVSDVQDRRELIMMMIGKAVFEEYVPRDAARSAVLLEARHVTNRKLNDISFNVREGEVVGFYGLVGAGKTELARAIFGLDQFSGEILYKGERIQSTPHRMIERGIVLVPEERRTQGLFTMLTVRNNISVMNMKKISMSGFINDSRDKETAREYIRRLQINTPSQEKEVSQLSGGNQQKVVFSKCLFADSSLMVLDEPTRGIDVGAKVELNKIIRALAQEGKAIILFSSELPEILNMCDRIILLTGGKIRAEIRNGPDVNSEEIVHIVTGGE